MNAAETILPRALALVQLFVSLLMFGIIIYVAASYAKGDAVPQRALVFPMAILAIDCTLMWLLSRRELSFRLYMMTIVLWLITTGYYVANLRSLLPA